MTPQGIDRLRALADKKIANAEYDRRSLCFLLTATNLMVVRCAASEIASASDASFFCRLTNGFTYAGAISLTEWPS